MGASSPSCAWWVRRRGGVVLYAVVRGRAPRPRRARGRGRLLPRSCAGAGRDGHHPRLSDSALACGRCSPSSTTSTATSAALDAVLEDCPAERFLLGGDYALGGPWPADTMDRLDELDAEWIRGNTDRWLVDDSDAPEPVAAGTRGVQGAAGRQSCRAARGSAGGDDEGRHALLPRLARVRHGRLPGRGEREGRGAHPRRRGQACDLRSHAHPVRADDAGAASSSSTRAASGFRSTTTTGRPTPCCTTTGASSCGVSSTTGARSSRSCVSAWGSPSRAGSSRPVSTRPPDSLGRSAPAERPRTARPPVLRPLRGGRGEHPARGGPARGDARGLPRAQRARPRDPDLRAGG